MININLNLKKSQILLRYIYYYNLKLFSKSHINSYSHLTKEDNVFETNQIHDIIIESKLEILNKEFSNENIIFQDKIINLFNIRKLKLNKINDLIIYFITDSIDDFYESYFLVCNKKQNSYLVDLRFNKNYFFENNIQQEQKEINMINILIKKAKKHKIKEIYFDNIENLHVYNNLLLKFNNIYYYIYNNNWYTKNFGFTTVEKINYDKMNTKINRLKSRYSENIDKIFLCKNYKKIYKATKKIYYMVNLLKL